MPKFFARFSYNGLTSFLLSALAFNGAAAIFFLPFFNPPLDDDALLVAVFAVEVAAFFVAVALPVTGDILKIDLNRTIQSRSKDELVFNNENTYTK
jgi:hypothetical protein